jgi:radical SAM superfamily enzyme YgiQ (UPF0313 family)
LVISFPCSKLFASSTIISSPSPSQIISTHFSLKTILGAKVGYIPPKITGIDKSSIAFASSRPWSYVISRTEKPIEDLSIPVIFGGIYPTFAPKIVLREKCVDMICEGEGEEMIVELANSLEQGKDITKILNLTVKRNGKIFRSGQEVILDDLPTGDNIYGERTGLRRPQTHMGETLLTPDYSIYDEKRFLKKMGGKVWRTVAMELSRGCPYTCTFCCVPMQQHQHRVSRDKYADFKGVDSKVLKMKDPYHREKPIPY